MKKEKSKKTKDHDIIKKWAKKRDGQPAIVKGTKEKGKGAGLLRINFADNQEKNLEDISWDEFFKTFDKSNLEFLYQEKTKEGKTSRFSKFIKSQK